MRVVAFSLIGFAWGFLGVWAFIHFWTREFDLEVRDLPVAFGVGVIFGPCWWLLGWFIREIDKRDRVLIRRRA